MSVDFGQDVAVFPDLDLTFAPLTGPRVVAEALARRLSTPRGTLPFSDNYGLDLRSWLNETIAPGRLGQLRRDLEAECLKDERVDSVASVAVLDAMQGALSIRLAITTAAGPFSLVLGVTAVTVAVLSVS